MDATASVLKEEKKARTKMMLSSIYLKKDQKNLKEAPISDMEVKR